MQSGCGMCKCECTKDGVCITCMSGDKACCDMIQACCDCLAVLGSRLLLLRLVRQHPGLLRQLLSCSLDRLIVFCDKTANPRPNTCLSRGFFLCAIAKRPTRLSSGSGYQLPLPKIHLLVGVVSSWQGPPQYCAISAKRIIFDVLTDEVAS